MTVTHHIAACACDAVTVAMQLHLQCGHSCNGLWLWLQFSCGCDVAALITAMAATHGATMAMATMADAAMTAIQRQFQDFGVY